MKILFLLLPLFLLLLVFASFIYSIFLFTKAKGNKNNLNKKKFAIVTLIPVILIAILIGFIFYSNANNDKKFKDDINSGVISVYKVGKHTDISKTKKVVLRNQSRETYGSFRIFAENLVVDYDGATIRIRTNEFKDIKQIRDNNIGFLRFISESGVGSVDRYERFLKSEKNQYIKRETNTGTIFEIDEKRKTHGRFMYKFFPKDSRFSLLISVRYLGEKNKSIRYTPVISREYAKKLFDLVTSTFDISDMNKLIDANNIDR